jgi:peptide/nickel transport system permease protein
MGVYLLRRLLLMPFTLFFIVLVNFIIINMAPGDPLTLKPLSPTGDVAKSDKESTAIKTDDPYVIFREHYGLTLPVVLNFWSFDSYDDVIKKLKRIVQLSSEKDASLKELVDNKIELGDEARFIMPLLKRALNDPTLNLEEKKVAINAFIRGASRFAIMGPSLDDIQKAYNKKIAKDNFFLRQQLVFDVTKDIQSQIENLNSFYNENALYYDYESSFSKKIKDLFLETRFYRYFKRVITLDFGTLRNNNQRPVIDEVITRIKYSLTLSVIPLLITFFLCLFLGLIMAVYQNTFIDRSLNLLFLILYAFPIFVVAPFLIEKIALDHNIPFTNHPFPLGGFSSIDAVYNNMTTLQKLLDISIHLVLPLLAILYGSLAVQARISRTAMLEVMRCDYVKTAKAKGVRPFNLYLKHVGRNGSITIVTSVASSLGAILGGSLIVETLFQINGFGKFFYEAILNRDYNVMMFSALAGSFLALLGYLAADIAYCFLDPRVTFD